MTRQFAVDQILIEEVARHSTSFDAHEKVFVINFKNSTEEELLDVLPRVFHNRNVSGQATLEEIDLQDKVWSSAIKSNCAVSEVV